MIFSCVLCMYVLGVINKKSFQLMFIKDTATATAIEHSRTAHLTHSFCIDSYTLHIKLIKNLLQKKKNKFPTTH